MIFSYKMNWFAVCVICMNIAVLQAKRDVNLKKLIEIIRRRNSMYPSNVILGAPRYPEHLPEAEPILPGHTLIRPSKGMLKSSVKFPLRDMGDSVVYGNLANLGLTDGSSRVMYSDFRKMLENDLLDQLALNIINARNNEKSHPVISSSEIADDAREINDDPRSDLLEESGEMIKDFRKRSHSKSKYRKRSRESRSVNSSSDDSSSSGSEEDESNPGNPYTIHKNKYKQNWLWNHFLDGDHMNINPYAPKFHVEGPTGSELFMGRKWWYFNQDDYKPLR